MGVKELLQGTLDICEDQLETFECFRAVVMSVSFSDSVLGEGTSL
jgi:hypothetical protein